MNARVRIAKSRDSWKRKAVERAGKNRYLKRCLQSSRLAAKALREKVQHLEAELERLQNLPAIPSRSPGPVLLDYAYAVRILSVLLVMQAVVSFRSVPRILALTNPQSWIPNFTSVINWTLRVGLAKLQEVKPIAERWIALIDMSIDIGLSKLLVVLRVPLGALAARGSAITLADCEAIGLRIRVAWDGESVAAALKDIFDVAGSPSAILKDGGTDLARGTTLWREENKKGSVKLLEDIGHVAANALKREFAKTKAFKNFLAYVKAASRKLWQSTLAYLTPPKLRTKGRFQGITRFTSWARRLKPLLGGKGAVEANSIAGQLRVIAGGLGSHAAFLARFTLTCEVVEHCLEIFKNKGMNRETYRKVMEELARLPEASIVRQRLEIWSQRHLGIQARLSISQTPLLVSTDIIESLFGKFKNALARSPNAEFNRTVLTIPCLCGKLDSSVVAAALNSVNHRQLQKWEAENVVGTQAQARRAFNRGELTPDKVPKTAQSQ